MSSDVVARSKPEKSFDFERWARASIIATSHMITKLAHARTVAFGVAALVIRSGIVTFGLPLVLVELSPLSNVIILNNQGLGLT